MPKTIRIRAVDDEVYAALARHAAQAGVTVPDLLRHAARLASRPTIEEWLERTRRRASDTAPEDVIGTLDTLRGTWPAGR